MYDAAHSQGVGIAAGRPGRPNRPFLTYPRNREEFTNCFLFCISHFSQASHSDPKRGGLGGPGGPRPGNPCGYPAHGARP